MSKFIELYNGGPARYKATLMDKTDRILSVTVDIDGYAEMDQEIPDKIDAIQCYHSYDLNDPKEIKVMREDMKELKRWHRQMVSAISHMEKVVLPKLRSYAQANADEE